MGVAPLFDRVSRMSWRISAWRGVSSFIAMYSMQGALTWGIYKGASPHYCPEMRRSVRAK